MLAKQFFWISHADFNGRIRLKEVLRTKTIKKLDTRFRHSSPVFISLSLSQSCSEVKNKSNWKNINLTRVFDYCSNTANIVNHRQSRICWKYINNNNILFVRTYSDDGKNVNNKLFNQWWKEKMIIVISLTITSRK